MASFTGKSLILLFTLLVLNGCGDLLGVRDIEDPDVNTGTTWVPATHGERIFSNLEMVFDERLEEYYLYNFLEEDSSSASFIFTPSPAASTLYPGRFSAWNLQDEYIYFNSLVNSVPADSLLSLEFSDILLNRDMGDSLEYEAAYRIEAHHRQEDLPGSYAGTCYFTMVRNSNNYWVIRRWEDVNSTGDADWSVLKASF